MEPWTPAGNIAVESLPSMWLVPQMLSLDIVLVALGWQLLFAKAYGIPLSAPVLFLTAVAVWCIYIGDHLLDTRGDTPLSPRHLFVRRHRRPLLSLAGVILAMSTVMLLWVPLHVLVCGALLATAVLFYMAVVHFASRSVKRAWPKEVLIGIVFALGSTIATWSAPHGRPSVFAAVFLFAMVCMVNCATLEYHEWRRNPAFGSVPHASTSWVGRKFAVSTLAVILGALAFSFVAHQWVLGTAIAAAAIVQALAISFTHRRPSDVVRAMVDATLLTPFLFIWIRL